MTKYLNPCAKTIGWADYTWNPVTGCLRGCPYCYARKIAWRFGKSKAEKNFEPRLHMERLDAPQKLKTPSRIFVCSMADLFGEWVSKAWIDRVFEAAQSAPQHQYLFLTQSPERYARHRKTYPINFWLGATVKSAFLLNSIITNLYSTKANRYISFEPLISAACWPESFKEHGYPQWIIVGAMSPYSKKTAPKPEWTQEIIDFAGENEIPLFLKNNLRWPESIQEFPDGLKLACGSGSAAAKEEEKK